MLKLQDLLETSETDDKNSVDDTPETPNLEDLEKTSSYLHHLATPDRIQDTAAKQAVVEDMLKEAGYMFDAVTGKWLNGRAARAAEKKLRGAEKALTAAKKNRKADKLLTEAEAIRNGEKMPNENIYKLLGIGAVGAAAGAGGYMYANKNKENELREVAKKYYQAGRNGR